MAFSQSKSSNTMRKWSTSTDRRSYSTRDRFKVSRETLIEKISIFQGHAGVLLLAGESKSHHPLKASHVLAMDVYFRVIHKGTTIFTLTIPEVWHPAEVVKFCQTDLKYFKDWFSGWYNAVGILNATEYLVHNGVGHLTEQNLVNLVEHHLPPRIIQQLNATKGQLESLSLDGLFGPALKLYGATCPCRKEAKYDYNHHIYDLEVWPLDLALSKASINQVLKRFDGFSYQAKKEACSVAVVGIEEAHPRVSTSRQRLL
ncbi:hypothetical protein ABVK25_005998 [Lepraria finkii]|uniref:Uncharacterized protein n=1 Tax=Lepraria finkii TaxID=1340010 RepID=A0ABR4B773_9LECA